MKEVPMPAEAREWLVQADLQRQAFLAGVIAALGLKNVRGVDLQRGVFQVEDDEPEGR